MRLTSCVEEIDNFPHLFISFCSCALVIPSITFSLLSTFFFTIRLLVRPYSCILTFFCFSSSSLFLILSFSKLSLLGFFSSYTIHHYFFLFIKHIYVFFFHILSCVSASMHTILFFVIILSLSLFCVLVSFCR